jgi:hypothetical protein
VCGIHETGLKLRGARAPRKVASVSPYIKKDVSQEKVPSQQEVEREQQKQQLDKESIALMMATRSRITSMTHTNIKVTRRTTLVHKAITWLGCLEHTPLLPFLPVEIRVMVCSLVVGPKDCTHDRRCVVLEGGRCCECDPDPDGWFCDACKRDMERERVKKERAAVETEECIDTADASLNLPAEVASLITLHSPDIACFYKWRAVSRAFRAVSEKQLAEVLGRGERAKKFLEAHYLQRRELGVFTTDTIDRTLLKKSFQQYWVGKTKTYVGLCVDIVWGTRKISVPRSYRKDIFAVNVMIHCTVFLNVDLVPHVSWASWYCETDKKNLESYENLKPYLTEYIHFYLMRTHSEFLRRQRKWVADDCISKLEGKTPEEAVALLEEMGW